MTDIQMTGLQPLLSNISYIEKSRENLDKFFRNVYFYYTRKGFRCTIISAITQYLMTFFLAFTATFMLTCINYPLLYQRLYKCPRAGLKLFGPDCHGDYAVDINWLTSMHPFIALTVIIFFIFWCIRLLIFLSSLRYLWRIRNFYRTLKITEKDLQTIAWSTVLDRLVSIQDNEFQAMGLAYCEHRLDQLDITYMITRVDNYLIGFYSQPFLGEALPASLQWNINYCIAFIIFDENHGIDVRVKNNFAQVVHQLRYHLKLFALINFVIMPFLLIYRVAWFCFEHASEIQKFSGHVTSRQWTPLAHWRLRGYCEVDHYFKKRLANSYITANEYINMFTSELYGALAQFISFVAGGALISLLLLSAIYDDVFFVAELTPGRSVTWWIFFLGIVLAALKSFIPNETIAYDPRGKMQELKEHIKYIPQSWQADRNSASVYREVTALFRSKLLIFIDELLAVITNPYVLWFRLPDEAENIVEFFRNNTKEINIGDVCSLAVFERDLIASQNPGMPDVPDVPDKIQNSIIDFRAHHPSWF